MRNKGFFWFITILLTAICVYQLSFTWVSNSVENKADRQAKEMVQSLRAEAMKGDGTAILPNDTKVDFNHADGEEIAQAAFVNQILRQKSETSVYPIFGSTFSEVKKRSLAFGLDLVGGMSITMEISIPELIENFAQNKRSKLFSTPYNQAKSIYATTGGDFIDIFVSQYKKANGASTKLVKAFDITDIDELGMNSSDDEVISFLKEKVATAIDGVELILNRRINQFGVAQPNIQKDPANNRLYVELPGVQDEETAIKQLVSTANLEFYETYQAGEISTQWQQAVEISKNDEVSIDELVEKELADSSSTDSSGVDSAKATTELDDLLNGGGTKTSKSGKSKSLSDLVKGGNQYTVGFATVADKPAADKILRRMDVMSAFPSDLVFMWSAVPERVSNNAKEMGYTLYAIRVPETGKPRVGGTDVESASTGFDQEQALVTVDLKMTPEGSDKWAQMTSENVGKLVAITMDSVVYSAPRVIDAITGGRTQISGSFSVEEANALTGLLNGGALPVKLAIKELTKVGPTIGAENSRTGLISFGIALLLVFVYMFFYYGKAGLIADIALFANIVFIFGSLASFGAVLTLAGLAGIVLTIGMAVDANVLIFERIREEQAAGKDLRGAVDTGFQKALSSIIDANVTTLLTAIVLKIFGSGPIESFATTLIIGIFTSVFAALVITRLVILRMLDKGKTVEFETKFTKGAFKHLNINFVGKRKLFYAISGTLVVIGIISLATKQLTPSVEFSGGRTFGVKFEKSAENEIEYLRENLRKVMVENNKPASIDLKTKSSNYFVEITTNYKLGKEDEKTSLEVKEKLEEALDVSKAKLGEYSVQESRNVSPTISSELKTSSLIAILLSMIIIFAYILLRFGSWQYSTGAILAMLHDVILVLACFSIFHGILPFNMDIDQAFIAAILTVIGYSINDTVIVFDRIREMLGLKKAGKDDGETINSALNSTLSRTINTSMTTFVVLLIIFIFGGAAIKGFIFALMIGVIVGTYSSLCIATPLLIDLSKKIKA
jgi:SecD/SecF fusion protein